MDNLLDDLGDVTHGSSSVTMLMSKDSKKKSLSTKNLSLGLAKHQPTASADSSSSSNESRSPATKKPPLATSKSAPAASNNPAESRITSV